MDMSNLTQANHDNLKGLVVLIGRAIAAKHCRNNEPSPIIENLCIYDTGDSEELIVRHEDNVIRIRVDYQSMDYHLFDDLEQLLREVA